MIKCILRLFLPTTLYIWIFYRCIDDTYLDWKKAKYFTPVCKRIYPVLLVDRAASWAIVLCGSYNIVHVIYAIIQGRLF